MKLGRGCSEMEPLGQVGGWLQRDKKLGQGGHRKDFGLSWRWRAPKGACRARTYIRRVPWVMVGCRQRTHLLRWVSSEEAQEGGFWRWD